MALILIKNIEYISLYEYIDVKSAVIDAILCINILNKPQVLNAVSSKASLEKKPVKNGNPIIANVAINMAP